MNPTRLLVLALVVNPAAGALAQPSAGLYFDPAHAGHGFDLQPVGNRWVLVFYTYESDGSPRWYLGVLEPRADHRFAGRIDAFDYSAQRQPPQRATGDGGEVTLDFSAGCDGTGDSGTVAAAFSWHLGGESGDWCVQPLVDQATPIDSDFTGLWYAGPQDQGWGLSLDFAAAGDGLVEVQVLFYFDREGQPRWALGVSEAGGPQATVDLESFHGYCRSCPSADLTSLPAGTITHALSLDPLGRPTGTAEFDVAYPLEPGGAWRRSGRIEPLSDPAPGLVPLPDRVEPTTATAFLDTTVVTLADGGAGLQEHQTVVVSDGMITAVGPHGTVPIPEDAVRIDGRGLYLGPGLADMHTHFTYGGRTPMLEAGLLFIANGVTTVLNMGDGLTLDLPGTDDLFGSEGIIGPSVYAGLVIYGPADGRASNVTLTGPGDVRDYVETGLQQGYDFIKVYNAVAPDTFARVIEVGAELGLPVVGHLPKTMPLEQALAGGQRMIAHVAEVYFTLFGNQPREELLPIAADLMLEHGVFLTDTLTASESFAAMYGGNEASFQAFIQREGVAYIPPSFVRNGWRGFFESATLQPSGSRPGQLDDRLAFFKRMVRHFSDAGVPIILGTDSPGHVGVISGFSVHENLRLYDEIGLPPLAAYRAAAANPGAFFEATLGSEAAFGTIAVGRRADLLLLERDPLADVTNLRNPLAVMTRGRLYSRELLRAELDRLDAKYPGPFAKRTPGSLAPLAEAHHCTDFPH